MKNSIIKFLTHVYELFTSVAGWISVTIGTLVNYLFSIDGFKDNVVVFAIVFVVDFTTGCFASWKESCIKNKSWSFFSSRRFRDSINKGLTYLLFICMSYVVWILFHNEPIQLPLLTKKLNIIQIAFGICLAIEFWSILENMKRLGFDIIGKINATAKGFWKTTKSIKGE